MLLLLALPVLIVVPWPWNLLGALAAGTLGGIEVLYWQQRRRRGKVAIGLESLVGATGQVTRACSPLGEVRLRGEIWEARAAAQIGRGTPVRVVGVNGRVLDVEPMTSGSRNGAKGLGAVAALLAAAIVLAGCGGDDESSAESWANDVCSSLSTWVTDLDDATQSLRDQGLSVDEEAVQTAVDQIADATRTLAEDLEELGPPDTEAGDRAQSELDSLATTLRSEVATVQEAVDSDQGAAAVTSTVGTSLSSAATEVESTFNDLEGLDPGGELADGFENADECDSFREQVKKLGS